MLFCSRPTYMNYPSNNIVNIITVSHFLIALLSYLILHVLSFCFHDPICLPPFDSFSFYPLITHAKCLIFDSFFCIGNWSLDFVVVKLDQKDYKNTKGP
jgi:hypothetical protein